MLKQRGVISRDEIGDEIQTATLFLFLNPAISQELDLTLNSKKSCDNEFFMGGSASRLRHRGCDMSDARESRDSFIDQSESGLIDKIQLAQNGDREALEELMEHYRGYLSLVADRNLHGKLKTKMSASDLVQESLVRVDQKMAGFRGGSTAEFEKWLRQIMTNLLTDKYRQLVQAQRRTVEREIAINDSALLSMPIEDRNPTPSTDAVLREKAVLIKGLLQQMSEKDRSVIHLRSWESQTFEEIGEALGMTTDGARKLWYRAIVRLQKLIEEKHPELPLDSLFLQPETKTDPS